VKTVKSVIIAMILYLAIFALALVFIHNYTDFVKTVVVATCTIGMSMLYAIALELDIIKDYVELIAMRLDIIRKLLEHERSREKAVG
jgi:hypothetical protein